jgi:hypothetical protein
MRECSWLEGYIEHLMVVVVKSLLRIHTIPTSYNQFIVTSIFSLDKNNTIYFSLPDGSIFLLPLNTTCK